MVKKYIYLGNRTCQENLEQTASTSPWKPVLVSLWTPEAMQFAWQHNLFTRFSENGNPSLCFIFWSSPVFYTVNNFCKCSFSDNTTAASLIVYCATQNLVCLHHTGHTHDIHVIFILTRLQCTRFILLKCNSITV